MKITSETNKVPLPPELICEKCSTGMKLGLKGWYCTDCNSPPKFIVKKD